jgi:hypothetical protein
MSKELYESQLIKETAKRFKTLCEYTFNITEDDGEETPEMDPQTNDNNPENGNEQLPPMGNDGMGGEMGGEEMPPMGEIPVGNEGEGGAPGFNPQEPMNDMGDTEPPMGGEMGGEEMPTEPMQPEDEVIDIDDLTTSQEETEEKVDDVNQSLQKGFKKLLGVVNKLNQMLDDNTANMEDLKREIEKRNPTPLEKLNMRSVNDSYPFNIKPNDYWKEKEMTSNYRIGDNEDKKEEYVITQGDIDKITDFSTISKDLSQASSNQNLLNIFGLR